MQSWRFWNKSHYFCYEKSFFHFFLFFIGIPSWRAKILLSRLLSKMTPRWCGPHVDSFSKRRPTFHRLSPHVGLAWWQFWFVPLGGISALIPLGAQSPNPLGDHGASRVNLCGLVPWLRFPKEMPCYVMNPSNFFLVVAHSIQLEFN